VKYPTHVIGPDGQPDLLCYHRLTAGVGDWRTYFDDDHELNAVAKMVREGFVLLPLDDRRDPDADWEDEPEKFGIDPIDELAGDGGAIFFSPGAAPDLRWGGHRPALSTYPGVAFRLSTLLEYGPTVYRPTDAQEIYNPLIFALENAASVPFHTGAEAALEAGADELFRLARKFYDYPIDNPQIFTRAMLMDGGAFAPPVLSDNAREALVAAFLASVHQLGDIYHDWARGDETPTEAQLREQAKDAITNLYQSTKFAYRESSRTSEVVLFPTEGLPLAVGEFMFFKDRMVSLVDGGAPAESALGGLSGPGGYLIARRVRGARVGRLRPRGIPARRRYG